MVDYSLKEPWEVLEDVIVVVGMFSYPMSFVVMKMEEGVDVPLIFGRPFLPYK